MMKRARRSFSSITSSARSARTIRFSVLDQLHLHMVHSVAASAKRVESGHPPHMKRTLPVTLAVGFIARGRLRLSITALVLLLSTLTPQLSTVLAQGPLAPPGAPAPT